MSDGHTNWARRLSEQRTSTFVGRTAELGLLRDLLRQSRVPYQVVAITGAPGTGKTTLLRVFSAECDAARIPHTIIDAGAIHASKDMLIRALRDCLELGPADSLPDALSKKHPRFILIIDNYDNLYPLHDWLCESLLSQFPASTFLVVASRKPLPDLWHTDPAWRELVQPLTLGNLSPAEASTYLKLRQVPAVYHDGLIHFSRGHPLALSLAADLYHQRSESTLSPSSAPDLMQTLVRRFVGDVADPTCRAALEACALIRVTTETVLAAMLDKQEARREFDWLCGLSFIDFSATGVYPHDLVREVLLFDLRWRSPDRYAFMRRRALQYYIGRLKTGPKQDSDAVLEDYLFLHRDHVLFRPFLREHGGPTMLSRCEPATPADYGRMLTLVHAYEGEPSRRILAHWLETQPDGAFVVRDEAGGVAAFMFIAKLKACGKVDVGEDHIARAIWRYLQEQRLPGPGGVATIMRFVVDARTYQALSPQIAALAVALLQHCLTLSNLEFTFNVMAHPEAWDHLAASTGFFPRADQFHFEVAGRPVGIFMQDWRQVPPEVWLTRLTPLEPPETEALPDKGVLHGADESQVASKRDFAEAVRHALKHFHAWDVLASNRLVNSALVRRAAGPRAGLEARIRALRQTISETVELIGTSPTRERFYRALWYTYLEPQGSQEQTAEFLDLPFSTYRGHLRSGINALTELLWQRQTDV